MYVHAFTCYDLCIIYHNYLCRTIFLQITFYTSLYPSPLVSCQFSRTFLHSDIPVYYTAKLNPSCPKSVFLKIHTRHKWQFYKLFGQCTLKLRRTDQASSKLLQGTGRDKKRKKAAHERPINQRPKRHNSNMLPRHAHLWPISSFFCIHAVKIEAARFEIQNECRRHIVNGLPLPGS